MSCNRGSDVAGTCFNAWVDRIPSRSPSKIVIVIPNNQRSMPKRRLCCNIQLVRRQVCPIHEADRAVELYAEVVGYDDACDYRSMHADVLLDLQYNMSRAWSTTCHALQHSMSGSCGTTRHAPGAACRILQCNRANSGGAACGLHVQGLIYTMVFLVTTSIKFK